MSEQANIDGLTVTVPGFDVILIPVDNKAERVKVLRNALAKELAAHIIESIENMLKKFFEDYSDKLKENNIATPCFAEFSYYYESDDEGGTTPYVESISLYDIDGNYVDNWHDIKVILKRSYGEYEYTMEEALRDYIYETDIDREELCDHCGDYTFSFGGKE